MLLAPLVAPVNVVLDVPVYVICSFSIYSVPEESNPDVLSTVIVVAESVKAPSKFVVSISSSCSILLATYSLYANKLKLFPLTPKSEFFTILAVL